MAGELGASKTATQSFTCSRCGGVFSEPRRAGRPRQLCAHCFGHAPYLTKTCAECGETQPLAEFYRHASQGDGHRSKCKRCELAAAKARFKADPERREKRLRYQRSWYSENRESLRDRGLRKTYGITSEDYDVLLAAQDGKCAICGTTEPRGHGRFHIDHNHETGVVRGLLCHSCNTGLGSFGDDAERLLLAVTYLSRSEALCRES